MAKREDIETAIWSDPDFLSLSGPARAVYVWSFTNHRPGMSGIYKVAPEQVALETGFRGRALEAALAELQEARFLFYDGRVMFVRTKTRRARNRSETVAKSIAADVVALRDHPFVRMWWEENKNQSWVTRLVEKPDFTGDSVDSTWTPAGPQEGSHVYVHVPVYVSGNEGEGGAGGEEGDDELAEPAEDRLPDGFPAEAIPLLDAAFPIVAEMARNGAPGASAVTRYQVAQTIQPRWQHKPIVRGAHDCAAHWAGKNPGVKRANAAYRNWLDHCDDLAAPESLNGNGVHTTRRGDAGRRETASDWLRDINGGEAA